MDRRQLRCEQIFELYGKPKTGCGDDYRFIHRAETSTVVRCICVSRESFLGEGIQIQTQHMSDASSNTGERQMISKGGRKRC